MGFSLGLLGGGAGKYMHYEMQGERGFSLGPNGLRNARREGFSLGPNGL